MSRYIDADALIMEMQKWDWQDLYLPIHFKELLIDEAPSIDIVRCSECKYNVSDGGAIMFCEHTDMPTEDNDFCSYGKHKKPCDTCKHDNEPWYSEACDGCCKAHSSYEPKGEE